MRKFLFDTDESSLMQERQWKISSLLIRSLSQSTAHNWGHEERVNDWIIISHYPTPISHIYCYKAYTNMADFAILHLQVAYPTIYNKINRYLWQTHVMSSTLTDLVSA